MEDAQATPSGGIPRPVAGLPEIGARPVGRTVDRGACRRRPFLARGSLARAPCYDGPVRAPLRSRELPLLWAAARQRLPGNTTATILRCRCRDGLPRCRPASLSPLRRVLPLAGGCLES